MNRANSRYRRYRWRAAAALGRPLPPTAVVHHADGSLSDDAPLVICENQGYHRLIHARMRVVRAGGNPNTDRICCRCAQVKPMTEFQKNWCGVCTRAYNTSHRPRYKAYMQAWRERRKANAGIARNE